MYVFHCHPLKSSHPHLLPLSPKVCSRNLERRHQQSRVQGSKGACILWVIRRRRRATRPGQRPGPGTWCCAPAREGDALAQPCGPASSPAPWPWVTSQPGEEHRHPGLEGGVVSGGDLAEGVRGPGPLSILAEARNQGLLCLALL